MLWMHKNNKRGEFVYTGACYLQFRRPNNHVITIPIPTRKPLPNPWNFLTGKSPIIHWWLYRCKFFSDMETGLTVFLSRKQCDQILMEAMLAEGVSWFKRYAIYVYARMLGWLWSGWIQHYIQEAYGKWS
jgi:hypothetical protein